MTHSTFTVTRNIFVILFITSALLVSAFPAYAQTGTNIALNKTATASSFEEQALNASKAVDGNANSRWASSNADANWITIDLGSLRSISGVKLNWETAYASAYQIQVSTDNVNWSTIYSTTQGKGGVETINATGSGRYVRLNATKRATYWGYSLWEFEIYEAPPTAPASNSSNLALNKTTTASTVQNTTYTATKATDGNSNSRWASSASDSNWIMADLGMVYAVSGVKLHWEAAYASSYEIQTSVDGNSWTKVYANTQGKGGIETLNFTGAGRYVRMKGIKRATGWGYSLWEFEVYGNLPSATNVARNKTVLSSTDESSRFSATNAVDGNTSSRWASKASDDNWVSIDLGSNHTVSRVKLNWETAHAREYKIQVSNNGSNWSTIFTETNGNGGIDDITLNGSGRYVRILGVKRATQWGYSLWEVEVYGYQSSAASSNSSVSSSSSANVTSSSVSSVSSVASSLSSSSVSSSSSSSADSNAPTVPGAVKATSFESRIEISWTPSIDNLGVTGYQIYRNNVKVADLSAAVTGYIDTNVVKDVTYSYRVRARDAAANWSAMSSAVTAKLISTGELTLMWSNPTSRENGEYLELDEIGGYEIRYKRVTDSTYTTVVINNNDTNSYSMSQPSGSFVYEIATFDTTGLYSTFVSIQPE